MQEVSKKSILESIETYISEKTALEAVQINKVFGDRIYKSPVENKRTSRYSQNSKSEEPSEPEEEEFKKPLTPEDIQKKLNDSINEVKRARDTLTNSKIDLNTLGKSPDELKNMFGTVLKQSGYSDEELRKIAPEFNKIISAKEDLNNFKGLLTKYPIKDFNKSEELHSNTSTSPENAPIIKPMYGIKMPSMEELNKEEKNKENPKEKVSEPFKGKIIWNPSISEEDKVEINKIPKEKWQTTNLKELLFTYPDIVKAKETNNLDMEITCRDDENMEFKIPYKYVKELYEDKGEGSIYPVDKEDITKTVQVGIPKSPYQVKVTAFKGQDILKRQKGNQEIYFEPISPEVLPDISTNKIQRIDNRLKAMKVISKDIKTPVEKSSLKLLNEKVIDNPKEPTLEKTVKTPKENISNWTPVPKSVSPQKTVKPDKESKKALSPFKHMLPTGQYEKFMKDRTEENKVKEVEQSLSPFKHMLPTGQYEKFKSDRIKENKLKQDFLR